MTNETPQYLSLSEAAERLGYAGTSTLRLNAIAGKIPGAFKIGKTWAVPVEWVNQQEKDGKPPGAGGPRGKGVRGKRKNATN